jgi:MFS family permease
MPVLREQHPFVGLIELTLCSIGAFGFGILSDIIGRKWTFNFSCLITSVFGMLLVSCLPLFS